MVRSLFAVAALSAFVVEAAKPLKFSADGTFQISVFEDLHFGDGEVTCVKL